MSVDPEQQRRRAFLLRGIACAALIYAVLAFVALRSVSPIEANFLSDGTGRPLWVYAEVLSVDALREEARLRFYFAEGTQEHESLFNSAPKRDVLVRVIADDTERTFLLRAGRPMSPVEIPIDLDGAERLFPFDSYRVAFEVSAFEGGQAASASAIPVRLTVWEGIDNWLVRTVSESRRPGIASALTISRSATIRFFACITYAAMALVGLSALTIGGLVFVGVRRVEATLGGAMGAMVFSLPALRNVLPGSPPLGVWPDILVFLWAEIAVVIGLSLFVWTWARRGPAPG